MLELRAGDSRYPTVEFVLDAVARWFKKYRSTHGSYDDLGQCGPEDMVKIARDLGLPASDLRALTVKAPDGANAVSTMLRALSMDPAVLLWVIRRQCQTCNELAFFVNEKTAVETSSPKILPLGIFASSARTLTPSTRCSDRESSCTGIDRPKKR